MTNDPVSVHTRFAADRGIGYTLLADRKAEIISAFGLINERFPRDSRWYGIALPMMFVIGSDGVITHRFSNTNYRERPDPDMVLRTLRKHAEG